MQTRDGISEKQKMYIAIDLKSFYASVECMDRDLDPLNTNLVVADASRTEKTICLAVSPSLKSYGIPGRARLFEVVQKVKEVNSIRASKIKYGKLTGESYFDDELKKDPSLAVSYIAAPPRMARYLEMSSKIFSIYLRYVSAQDVHVYSIDEVFIDVTPYLNTYKTTAHDLAMTMIHDVLRETGITATAGVGTNMYLAKIAMDIVAKHSEPDKDGVRIAELDEMSYRKILWTHEPLTDFWRIGRGYAKKLNSHGMYTMGDIARCSLGKKMEFYNEDLLYKLFGVGAELLIDHAWGWEPCTMDEIKKYEPDKNSVSSGQVLKEPYTCEKARLVLNEMAEQLSLDLVNKKIMTDQIVLTIGYDVENLSDPAISSKYKGEITIDFYGRQVPKHAHGTSNLGPHTQSSSVITGNTLKLYDRIINPDLLIRRIAIAACNVLPEEKVRKSEVQEQLDIFSIGKTEEDYKRDELEREKEKSIQETMNEIKKKFGKNAVVKAMNLEEGATAMERNGQIGGHKA